MPTETLEAPDTESQVESPSTSANTSNDAPETNIASTNQPSDDILSKIKIDTSDLDDDTSVAPSEKGEYSGVAKKLPKLAPLKKAGEEDDGEDGEEELEKPAVSRLPKTQVENHQDKTEIPSGGRNYDQFPEELRPRLKHFNNKAFAWFEEHYPKFEQTQKELVDTRQALEDAKKGIVKIPDNYYENPNAFILDPKFQEITKNFDQVSLEAQHYAEQLEKIESGEMFQELRGFQRDGRMVLGEPRKPTAKDKIDLQTSLHQARSYQRDFENQAAQLQNSYAGRHKEASSVIQNVMTKFIPWESDPKLLDQTIPSADGKTPRSIKSLIEEYTALVPAQFRNNIMTRAWANTMIVNLMQSRELAKHNTTAQVAATNKNHQQQAQPGAGKNGGSLSKVSAGGKLKQFNTDEMDD